MNNKKLLSLVLSIVMVLSLAVPAMAVDELPEGWTPADGARGVAAEDVVILYTNDVHTYIDNTRETEDGSKVPGLRYSTIAAYKAACGADFLVDAGDHIQGTVYGSTDKGATIIDLMNATGYTASTLGNHEFDYEMPRILELIGKANYDYVSCNILNVDGSQLLDSFKVYTAANGKTVAFVGFTTPETYTKSTPKYFMNEAGEIVWGFSQGDEGAKLYAVAQQNIDAAAQVADYVIGVGHMGVDEASAPYTSEDVIAHTTGLTAFIDGHSHTTMELKMVADKSGKEIPLTQTGCYLAALGEMHISPDGSITTKLLSAEDLAGYSDPTVAAIEDAYIAEVNAKLEEVIGATAVNLTINGADGKRSIRKEETNLGNFCADAYMYVCEKNGYSPDVAFMQGGGIRATIEAGNITAKTLRTVYPWAGGEVAIRAMSGQELLDALEWSYRTANVENTNEVGGFLQLANMKVEVNLATPSTVQQDDLQVWTGGPTGAYRVQKVEILNKDTGAYEPIDLNKTYAVASTKYLLTEMGDGYNMFTGEYVAGFVCDDYTSLEDYIKSFPVDPATGLPTVGAGMGYDEFQHMGRINYVNVPAADNTPAVEQPAPQQPAVEQSATQQPAGNTHVVVKGDNLSKLALKYLGDAAKWKAIYEANKGIIKDPNLIYIGQVLTIPQ